MSTHQILYGDEGERFLDLVLPLVSELRSTQVRYSIMDTQKFHALLNGDMQSALHVYWHEILGRAHLAAAASCIRSFRWCEGMSAAYTAKTFLPYCASFRGLVESLADTYDALNGVAIMLAENHGAIEGALAKTTTVPTVSQELENALIHFAYAHKPPKGVEVPATHIAKTVVDYLKPLTKNESLDVRQLYSELCQYTHPAAHSVHYMLVHENQDSFVLVGDHDQVRIEKFAEASRHFFPSLFMLAFNAPMLVLKVLRSFAVPDYHVGFTDKVDLTDIPAWRRISKLPGMSAMQ
jgi:hypothetical protein